MTVEHSLLTGSSLHEPKGVDSASSGEVYIADGIGSGAWTGTGSFNAFGNALLHVRDSRTNGSSADNVTNGIWNKRTLQTILDNEIASSSLTSSVISLPQGTYYCQAIADFYSSMALTNGTSATVWGKLRLRNTTNSTELILGHGVKRSIAFSANVSSANLNEEVSIPIILNGRFTLEGTRNIELQHYAAFSGNVSTLTGGIPIGSGSSEVYADLMIWKIA